MVMWHKLYKLTEIMLNKEMTLYKSVVMEITFQLKVMAI